jgi:hypothetical protein
VYVIDNAPKNLIYYFIIVGTQLSAATPASITLVGLRNPIDYTPGLSISMVYW